MPFSKLDVGVNRIFTSCVDFELFRSIPVPKSQKRDPGAPGETLDACIYLDHNSYIQGG
jgi:hypothetical protein